MGSATGQTVKDRVAVVGIGETTYYRRGESPLSEFQLTCHAILNAAVDAGLDPHEIDGIASFSDDRNHGTRIASALGMREMGFVNMFWGGAGGGVCGAVGNAAAALIAGYTNYVVVYRGLAQGQFWRFGQSGHAGALVGPDSYVAPYGVMTPAHHIALRTRRFMYNHGVSQDPLAAIALSSYEHAQRNPRAVMYGHPLTREAYDQSRWIVEPFHLFDCCQENDGAAAVILTTVERAKDLKQTPALLMAAAQGTDYRYELNTHNSPDYATANFKPLARRLYEMADIAPKDIDVAQIYENFTGGTLMSLIEHGFCEPDEAEEFCTVENLTGPQARLPLNTSGGNLAECYMHGMGLMNEAVRQLRGTSTCQVEDARTVLVAGGPVTAPVSTLILHR